MNTSVNKEYKAQLQQQFKQTGNLCNIDTNTFNKVNDGDPQPVDAMQGYYH